MTRPVTLEYEQQAPPNRYEWEMESERARWLRRRFLWFSGTLVVVAAVMLLGNVMDLFTFSGSGRSAATVELFSNLVKMGAAGWAWWYARGQIRNERRLFAIAFWLVVGMGVFGIFASRVSTELGFIQHMRRLEAGEELRLRESGLEITSRSEGEIQRRLETSEEPDAQLPAPPPRTAPAGPSPSMLSGIRQGVSLWTIWASVFFSHLLACLFLPWTVREATKPALILLAAAGFLVAGDLLLGRGSVWYLGSALVLLPLTVLPGIGWSWWRYSRFRRNFRNVFESKQLRQLTYELSGARRIHESSLPPVVETGPVRLSYIYEPMSQIGGDVLFVHPRPPEGPGNPADHDGFCQARRQTVVLLDVTGHGIAAALTVNRLVGELERVFAERPDIGAGELMESLNKYVYLTLATHGVFVTGVVIRGDMTMHDDRAACYREPLQISFASAGHPTAFIRRPDGAINRLESNATMLGVLPPETYDSDEQIVLMQPGDAVVAYTDGAIEARNLEDEMIGIEGVCDLVSNIGNETVDPSRWPELLIRRVAAWRNAPPADDTLIACVYRPPVPAEMAGTADAELTTREPALVA
jgi:sigma-B regulation protein RsbU (phosphoserine phosphatase)